MDYSLNRCSDGESILFNSFDEAVEHIVFFHPELVVIKDENLRGVWWVGDRYMLTNWTRAVISRGD